MNSLSQSDQDLLEQIKKQIEVASGLGWGTDWVQKDYDFLVFFIEDQTGVSLSLSTIKRIWRKGYRRLPHISTLDVLSQLAYKKDWLALKKDWLEQGPEKQGTVPGPELGKRNPMVYILVPMILLLALSVGVPWAVGGNEKAIVGAVGNGAPKAMGEVHFSYKKSVDGQIPNTVVFQYDVESVEADSFFLQQNWDVGRRVEIFKENKERTDIYYIPGYFTARLLADGQVIKQIPIHITYDGWFAAIRQPFPKVKAFDKKHWENKAYLGIDKRDLKSNNIDLSQDFQLSYYQVREFGLDGDNFAYATKFKMDRVEAVRCPQISLHVQGDQGYYWIMFGNKGCESELSTRLGDRLHYGKTEDLTMFGTNMYEWQQVDISVVDKKVEFELNGKNIFSSKYEQSIGTIKEISYFFNGIGMIDDVTLWDAGHTVQFSDDFE